MYIDVHISIISPKDQKSQAVEELLFSIQLRKELELKQEQGREKVKGGRGVGEQPGQSEID